MPHRQMRSSLVWGLRVGAAVLALLAVLSILSTAWPGDYAMAIDEQPFPILLIQLLVPPVYLGLLTAGIVEVLGFARRILRLP
jgi:hypothetical protein